MNRIILTLARRLTAIVILCSFVFSSSCVTAHVLARAEKEKEYEYYKNKDVFVKATGTITYIKYVDEDGYTSLALAFSDLTPHFEYDGAAFSIKDENYKIVLKNGIKNKIEVGDTIHFMSAPKYFGDGYVIPIVEIKVDGEELLSFDEGHANLLKQLKE